MTEMVIIAPIVFMMIFGCLQFALIYQAKTTLDYAVFNAARIGSVNNASFESVRRGFVMGMAPFYTYDNDPFKVTEAVSIVDGMVSTGYVRFLRINPTRLAFAEYGTDTDPATGWRMIPNDNLMFRPATIGGSQVNIQDANLLKVHVTFCYHLSFPIIRNVIRDMVWRYRIGHNTLDCAQSTGDEFTIPIVASSIARMQSAAIEDPAWDAWPYGSASSNFLNLGGVGTAAGGVSYTPDE